MSEDVVLVEREDGVAVVTLNRPDRLNALGRELIEALPERLAELAADRAVRCVVLTGAGRGFCAGGDIREMAGDAALTYEEEVEEQQGFHRAPALLFGMRKPTIAMVNGWCFGGGLSPLVACDLAVAADDVEVGTPEIDIGLWPYQITVPLIRSMPPKVALDLMLTGRKVKAPEGERMGFVSRLVSVEELDKTVDELAATLAGKSAVVMRWGRRSFYRVIDMAGEEALEYLHAMLTVATHTDDAQEGLTAFAEKRAPKWTHQ